MLARDLQFCNPQGLLLSGGLCLKCNDLSQDHIEMALRLEIERRLGCPTGDYNKLCFRHATAIALVVHS